jgi:hypothetical protein
MGTVLFMTTATIVMKHQNTCKTVFFGEVCQQLDNAYILQRTFQRVTDSSGTFTRSLSNRLPASTEEKTVQINNYNTKRKKNLIIFKFLFRRIGFICRTNLKNQSSYFNFQHYKLHFI